MLHRVYSAREFQFLESAANINKSPRPTVKVQTPAKIWGVPQSLLWLL